MSHATVMVLGPKDEAELAEAMAPFNEEIQVEPYFDAVTWLLDQREEGESLEAFAARKNAEWEYDPDDDGALLVRDGVLGTMSTYNPLSKWDWYVVGGRWRGKLPLTAEAQLAGQGMLGQPGTMMSADDKMFAEGVDVARLGDIDFAMLRVDAAARATADFDTADAARAGRTLPPFPPEDSDRETWQAWWNHPVIADIKKAYETGLFMTPHDLVDMLSDRQRYIDRAVAGAVTCYATLVPGEGWLAPGDMGWFGLSTDDGESRDAYNDKINKLLDAADPDTMVWVVDFHI